MTSYMHRPSAPLLDHECSPELCTRGPREVVHREVPEQFTPYNEGDPSSPTISAALECYDDLDPAGELEGSRLLTTVGMGAELSTMDLDQLEALWRWLRGVERRGRGLIAGQAPGV